MMQDSEGEESPLAGEVVADSNNHLHQHDVDLNIQLSSLQDDDHKGHNNISESVCIVDDVEQDVILDDAMFLSQEVMLVIAPLIILAIFWYIYKKWSIRISNNNHKSCCIWKDEVTSLSVLSNVSYCCEEAVKSLLDQQEVDPDYSRQDLINIIESSNSLFSYVFKNEQEGGNGRRFGSLQEVCPRDVEEELFQVSCLVKSVKIRRTVLLANEVLKDLQDFVRDIKNHLSSAVVLENVSRCSYVIVRLVVDVMMRFTYSSSFVYDVKDNAIDLIYLLFIIIIDTGE